MRVQIRLPDAAWDRIREAAVQQRRYPKQQVEYLVLKALGMLPTETPCREEASLGVQNDCQG